MAVIEYTSVVWNMFLVDKMQVEIFERMTIHSKEECFVPHDAHLY